MTSGQRNYLVFVLTIALLGFVGVISYAPARHFFALIFEGASLSRILGFVVLCIAVAWFAVIKPLRNR